MIKLVDMDCVPPRKNDPPVAEGQMTEHLLQIPEWEILELNGIERLQRIYKFDNFITALKFTNLVGALAEEQDHHPALVTEWGKVTVTWWTHAVKGLHLNDLIAAAKTDQVYTP